MAKPQSAADLRKQIAEHQANLVRLGEAWGQQVVDALDDADRATIARLKSMLDALSYRRNTAEGVEQLDEIRKKLEEIRLKAYRKAERKLRADAFDLMSNEVKWARRILLAFLGSRAIRGGSGGSAPDDDELAGKWLKEYAAGRSPEASRAPAPSTPGAGSSSSSSATVSPEKIPDAISAAEQKRIVKNAVIQDKSWAKWWTHTADADIQRIAETVNQGVNEGWSIDQITAKVMGTEAGEFTDGTLSTNRARVRNMARTICSGIANEAKDAFYRENSDVCIGVEWLDTLDGRTCRHCASLSRKRWKTDEPHPVPPVHPNCRCVLLPVTPASDSADEQRPAAKADFMAEARRAYEKKHPGKKWEELAESTRKKYYYDAIHDYEKRTGGPAFELVSGGMSFKEYFETVMTEQQRKDWLGPERYKLYRKGLKFDDFVAPWPRPEMTVKQLKALDLASLGE
ncbi:minor capsid protein [Victivallis vadensis]|uniref:minor capsid protein n=1 Tax=Victivallis vadensis TaxID=172901 RepID=UPI00266D19D7|nr:minor capsid protein [Victivallis vadensis]